MEQPAAYPNVYRRRFVFFEDKRVSRIEKGEVMKKFENFDYFIRHNLVEIRTTCNIKEEEVLFSDHRED